MSTLRESAPPQIIPNQRPTGGRWLILSLACGTSFFLYLHRFTWNFVAPELQETYGWTEFETQAAYSAFSWTYGMGQIPSGILIDRFGPRFFLATIIAGWSLVIPWQAAGVGWIVSTSRAMIGVTQAGCYPALASVTARWFPRRYRTIIQSLVATFCGRGGGAIAPILIATVLMSLCGLSLWTSLWVLTGMGMAFSVLFAVLFRNSPNEATWVNDAERKLILDDSESHTPTDSSRTQTLPADASATSSPAVPTFETSSQRHARAVFEKFPILLAFQLPSVWIIATMQMFVAGVDTIYSSLLGQYFASRGVALGKAGLLASVPLFGGMLGGLIAAVSSDSLQSVFSSRVIARRVIGVTGNLCACGMMFVMIQQSDPVWAAFALGGVKFFADMSQPIGWGACTDIGGKRGSATVFSIMNSGGNVGGALLPLVFGLILSQSQVVAVVGEVQHRDFIPMFTFAATIYIAAGVMWLFIDTKRTLDDVAREQLASRQ